MVFVLITDKLKISATACWLSFTQVTPMQFNGCHMEDHGVSRIKQNLWMKFCPDTSRLPTSIHLFALSMRGGAYCGSDERTTLLSAKITNSPSSSNFCHVNYFYSTRFRRIKFGNDTDSYYHEVRDGDDGCVTIEVRKCCRVSLELKTQTVSFFHCNE